MTLRIAIAYNFNDRDWHGGRNYFGSLFRAVAATQGEEVQFVLVLGEKTATTLPDEFPEIEVIRTPLMDRNHPLWLARQFGLRAFDVDPLLGAFLQRRGIDLLSHSGQLGPQRTIKTLPWLYDFQFMHLPELWKRRHIRWAEQRYRAACRNADALVVSSEQALSDLRRFAPWCKKPQFVLRFVSNPVDFSGLLSREELLHEYSLPEDFFYLPNQFWANKNHRLAIDALIELRSRGVNSTIVCTGHTFDGRLPNYFGELMDYLSASGVKDGFRVLGVVPYRHAQSVMAHARAVINPSRFEGWSTTVEEAKTMQKRLLLSDIPVHREQCSFEGHFFSADDPSALADLLEETLSMRAIPIDPCRASLDYCRRLQEFGRDYLDIVRSLH